ncbi:hypothetical protein PZ938_06225 [Luteipulveratus sp. YIM 133132]|uniref:hypothetical protein n=1 Tax=Luteipulveratus flavus TaxID=3031728 RepID=UPI0023B062B7|nr:hypothetical protein [Luteipulveratus sp. YIM 133132]MDE9365197.1 hypothetical protein [Luteipulveratus sp. YIM 133132]
MLNDPELDELENRLRAEYAAWAPDAIDRTAVIASARTRAGAIRRRRTIARTAGAALGVVAITGAGLVGAQLHGGGSAQPAHTTGSPTRTSAPVESRLVPEPTGQHAFAIPTSLFPTTPVGGITFEHKGAQNALAPGFENQTCGTQSGRPHTTAPAAGVSQTRVGGGNRMRVAISNVGTGAAISDIHFATGYCYFTSAQPVQQFAWNNWLLGGNPPTRTPDPGEQRELYRWTAEPTHPDRAGSDTVVGAVLAVDGFLVTVSAQHADPKVALSNATALADATRAQILATGRSADSLSGEVSFDGALPRGSSSPAPRAVSAVPPTDETVPADVALVASQLLPSSAQLGGLRYFAQPPGPDTPPSDRASAPMVRRPNLPGQQCLSNELGDHPSPISSLTAVAARRSGRTDDPSVVSAIVRYRSKDVGTALAEARSNTGPCRWGDFDTRAQPAPRTTRAVSGHDGATTFAFTQPTGEGGVRTIVVQRVGDYLVSAKTRSDARSDEPRLLALAVAATDAMVTNLRGEGLVG